MASFALRKTSIHLHFSSLPIDLWVVVLEPGVTEDHVLPSKARDSEERPFRVGFVMENYVYHFRDLICLVGRAVHVVYWYGARDTPGVNAFHSNKVSIYEVARSSGVQKCLDGESFGQPFFSFWLPGLRCPVQSRRGEKGCVYRFTDICIDLFYV